MPQQPEVKDDWGDSPSSPSPNAKLFEWGDEGDAHAESAPAKQIGQVDPKQKEFQDEVRYIRSVYTPESAVRALPFAIGGGIQNVGEELPAAVKLLNRVRGLFGAKPIAAPPAEPPITPTPAQHLQNVIAQSRERAALPPFPNRAEGLDEIEAMRPEATAKLRSIVESDRQPVDTSRARVGALLNKATGAQPLTKGIPLKDQGSSVIESFKYDPGSREMTVSTKNGGQYIHGDVTPEQAQTFEQAASKGKAWNDLRNNSTLVAKVVNGKRVAIKPPSAIKTADPNDLTPILQESLKRVNPKQ